MAAVQSVPAAAAAGRKGMGVGRRKQLEKAIGMQPAPNVTNSADHFAIIHAKTGEMVKLDILYN